MSAMQNLPTNFNLLSPVGFRFQLSRFPEVTYFCQSANIPGVSVGQVDVGTPMKTAYFHGDEVTYDELDAISIEDESEEHNDNIEI